MSSIEQLKAEARALREAAKKQGNALRHSEALELTAKRHGYASWRAARALLGKDAAAPAVPPPRVGPAPGRRMSPSSLLPDGDFVANRERAFTRWMSPAERQAAVESAKRMGLLPLYAETSGEGTRYLFWALPQGAACEVRSGRSQERIEAFDRANAAKGRRMVSLHASGAPAYSAVWISAEHHAQATEHLRRFGIGAASQD